MNIIFLDCTQNYGHQFSATNSKTRFMIKGLKAQGDSCTIINSINGMAGIQKTETITDSEVGEVITYPCKRNKIINWLFNIKPLYHDLKIHRQKDKKNFIILEFPYFHIYIIYILLARLLNYKIITISHEWGSTFKSTKFIRKISIGLYTKTFGYMVDGILPISEYIIERIKHFHKPYIKVPIMADFNVLTKTSSNHIGHEKEPYFLYCVYAGYKREIIPIIDSYRTYKEKGGKCHLLLILSGTSTQINTIQNYINEINETEYISIKTKIPNSELWHLYSNAVGLIIPLNPNYEQDKARFSQKIAEYLSSGSPIISNNVGEIKYYFTDKENIILCDYPNGFSDAFAWITKNPLLSKEIGYKGYELGISNFDYQVIGKRLHNFLYQI